MPTIPTQLLQVSLGPEVIQNGQREQENFGQVCETPAC